MPEPVERSGSIPHRASVDEIQVRHNRRRGKEIAVEAAKATGKPQQIAEKIAEGKMQAFYAERTLLDQEFFNGQKFKGTIAQLLKSKGVSLEQYVRIEVGQQ